MHESMMIADVGDIANVSGSRIATPLAPPRPGSTPMITPSTMPVNISARLSGVRTTAKPLSRDESSSTSGPRQRGGIEAGRLRPLADECVHDFASGHGHVREASHLEDRAQQRVNLHGPSSFQIDER